MIKNKRNKDCIAFHLSILYQKPFKSLPLSMRYSLTFRTLSLLDLIRGTQQEYSSKPLKHSIVKRILVFKR